MKKDKKIGKLLVSAGLFIGIGVGLIIDNVAAGTLIGLGVGFLATFLFLFKNQSK
ncbi:hypothetical protein ACFL08_05715 [Patescibacteria group bacterium]